MARKRVLSVGQCGFDHGNLARALGKHYDAEVVAADDAAAALAALRGNNFDLVLVNRVLDADGSSGVGLIRQIRSDEQLTGVPVMLVSNQEDAQQEAIQAGALRGFGKAALDHPQTISRLVALLKPP